MIRDKKKQNPLMVPGILAAALLISVFINLRCTGFLAPSGSIPSDARNNFRLMAEAWNDISAHYVDRSAIQPIPLTYGAISGMVDALGDTGHSTFLSPQMLKAEREYAKGRYKGVGIEIRMKQGETVIVAPLDGSPAQKAGLLPGEIITTVDGQTVKGLTLLHVVALISGPTGTKVILNIFNPDTGQKRDVTMIRADITVKNVTWHRLPGTEVAHLRIAAFSENVTENLKTVLKKIKKENITGLILDLRNDPGGLYDYAISTASQFLSNGDVVLTRDAKGNITPVSVEKGGVALQIPIVGLVNGGTASASEIVAGALQDHHRAVLVGTTTFGTGTVLESFPLSDGSALMLAVEEWLTPDGHAIWHKGITPNVVVQLPGAVFPLFPEAEQGMTPENLRESRDTQLLRALDLLTHRNGQKTEHIHSSHASSLGHSPELFRP